MFPLWFSGKGLFQIYVAFLLHVALMLNVTFLLHDRRSVKRSTKITMIFSMQQQNNGKVNLFFFYINSSYHSSDIRFKEPYDYRLTNTFSQYIRICIIKLFF